MRPLPGDDAFQGRSRSSSDNETPLAIRTQPQQMTYFFTDENSIGDSQAHPSLVQPKQKDTSKDSTYGVESLETTISSLAQEDSDDQEEKAQTARRNWKKHLRQSRLSDDDLASSISPSSKSSNESRNASPCHQRRPSHTAISRPFTPLSFGSPAPRSIISSPDSRRNSDAGSLMDDTNSQAIIWSGDEDKEMGSGLLDSGSAPQLVMPSIKMPSRRPFTEKGKNMGRLKVLVAGDSGVGKTSLIKAIVQTCDDIVHVDALSSDPVATSETRRKSSKSKSRSGSADMQSTTQITEVYASTRAYPAWWSDLEESRILRRRKSMGDSVLERNLCFVDTPGYGNKTSCLESIMPVVNYIESHLQKFASMQGLSESDMINMLSGNGGSQVDLVFYLFTQIRSVDIEYLRRISPLTNIVPLIARTDYANTEELGFLKENIRAELESNNIKPFLFGLSPEEAICPLPQSPYTISTYPSKDDDTMDASLLMSPDYIQPLIPSELAYLVSEVFSPETISWLRHSAAKKFIQWNNTNTPTMKPQSLYRPLTSSYSSSASQNQFLTAPVGTTTSYALARITDHTQREEKIAQVRLANWAADLQRSLQNERARFDALARSERAVWLTERLGECVQDGTIIPLSQARQQSPIQDSWASALVKQSGGTYIRNREEAKVRELDVRDPLGLLMMNEELKRKGWIALQVVSSFGIIGGLALWVSRSWNAGENELGFWGLDWTGFRVVDWR
ncbi:Septin-2B [Hyphodiscus hymeniophilus]|uniref:Septin-2B n=1 Tax=Hyphodiscus hymeniophilus TaxID=353542 RepID=A0A9P7AV53_9HELO|nr:Septin-2B [Hyphodiscus hymeniophilus]